MLIDEFSYFNFLEGDMVVLNEFFDVVVFEDLVWFFGDNCDCLWDFCVY